MCPALPRDVVVFGKKPDPPPQEPEPQEFLDADLERKLNLLEKTLAHRAIHLLELGFTLEQVMVLVHTPDIVHAAEPLITKGCPVHVAFDLLSP